VYLLFISNFCVDQNDDTFIENGMSKKVDKNNVKRKKRRKCLRDKTAPRPPHSGNLNKQLLINTIVLVRYIT